MVIISLILGAIFHGDMDDNPLFDTLWLAGLFISVVAVLPQYWMISKSCGQLQLLTGHYIAATAIDRMCAMGWRGRAHDLRDIACAFDPLAALE